MRHLSGLRGVGPFFTYPAKAIYGEQRKRVRRSGLCVIGSAAADAPHNNFGPNDVAGWGAGWGSPAARPRPCSAIQLRGHAKAAENLGALIFGQY